MIVCDGVLFLGRDLFMFLTVMSQFIIINISYKLESGSQNVEGSWVFSKGVSLLG